MKKEIKDHFRIRLAGEKAWYPMTIPGTAMEVFCREGIIPDPYYERNEENVREFLNHDFEIEGKFDLSGKEDAYEHLELVFYGVDTLVKLYVNENYVGHMENMHRIYSFSVREWVKKGENRIRMEFASPQTYIKNYQPEKGREIHMANTGTMLGEQYLRKAHCMFGWDWGPQLPDLGIFRKIELQGYHKIKLGDTLVRQKHQEGSVTLVFETEVMGEKDAGKMAEVLYEVTDPDGKVIASGKEKEIQIDRPLLWWPNGMGEQPLYTVKTTLCSEQEETEEKSFRIGLRTVTIAREADIWGEEFAIQVNGVKIFAKGADYIPDDCFYSRITPEVLKRDAEAAVFANFNCLRVWGGGYYPSDEFYDLCDEYGILLWQDLMYACNIYDLTKEFTDNIKQETRDNLRRFRNHACLALICGNNEMETAWVEWEAMKGHAPSLKRDYLLQFEYLLAQIVREEAPDTFYWPSSPSSGGSFDAPGDENRGDSHYWDVWHGQKPFQEYQNHYFRFCSEFGFQSLPSMKTIASFAQKKDWNLFSRVMESHQKNPSANGKILYYLSENFRYPKDLEQLVFLSQILQGCAMKAAVEHWRRNRGRCMGSIYWQFNDNWPVASWASMDYYGRYKALHYMAREFYAPVAASLERQEKQMKFWVSNESLVPCRVYGRLQLKRMDFTVLWEMEVEGQINALSAECLAVHDFSKIIQDQEEEVFAAADYTYEQKGIRKSGRVFETFVPVKYLNLREPSIDIDQDEKGTVTLRAESFVPYCMLEGVKEDCIWEKNIVSLTGPEPVIIKQEKNQTGKQTEIRVYDVYHTYQKKDREAENEF